MCIYRKLAIASLAFFLATPLATSAFAARHVALVIGNDQYQNLPKLQKAVADARSYADVLKAKGFDQVILKSDLTRGQLDEAIASFLDQIEPGDTAVFAYSGHGWSDGTQNYIVGTDAPVTGTQDFLARISIPLKNGVNGIIDEMDQKGATLKVAVIDACRDNPFTPPVGKRSIGLSRGMSRIDASNGTFVVFSAGAGQSALDRLSDSDPDPNSVFTRVFVPAIRADMTLQEAIKTTQEQVVALAKSVQQDQKPAYYDEVIGSACLSGSCATAAKKLLSPADNAAAAYQAALSVNTLDAWDAFLKYHAEGFYADLARVARTKLGLAAIASLGKQTSAPPPEVTPTPAVSLTEAVSEEAVFLEMPRDGSKEHSLKGTVTWRLVPEDTDGPVIEAKAYLPESQLTLTLSIRRNTDKHIQASHIAAIHIDPPEIRGRIVEVKGIVMQDGGGSPSEPLVGNPYKVADQDFGFSLLAESDVPDNIAHLRDKKSITLLLDGEAGSRGAVTLQKGSTGQKVIELALAAWESLAKK